MSIEKTPDQIKKHKKDAMSKLNSYLDACIFSGNKKHEKKADLISYWLESFTTYARAEESFDPTKLLSYSRGDVIRLNFGFNIGKEFGGLHFAVVIDNDNKHTADVLTVIPLSSTDGKVVHERSVDLGEELYNKISDTQKKLLADATEDLESITAFMHTFKSSIDLVESLLKEGKEISDEVVSAMELAKERYKELESEKTALEERIRNIHKNDSVIAKLKIGSMAVTNQITTVSKQRIYTPKRSEDFLYGISLSTTAMDKINKKIVELFIHQDRI